MSSDTVVVFSRRSDLLPLLRDKCGDLRFVAPPDAAEAIVALVDDDSASELGAAAEHIAARVIVGSVDSDHRRRGDFAVPRKVFLADPGEYLRFAAQFAQACSHAATIENELEYVGQVQELMSMSDAATVSEKITRTALGILGLERGTLLLHDPRVERYVVSFSNDPDFVETGEFLPGIAPALLQRALSSSSAYTLETDHDGNGMLVVPLQVEEDLVGVIRIPLVAGDKVTEEVSASVNKYLRMVARVLGNIYQLTRSQDLAMLDDLTKAFNRRFFETYLDEEIERSRRYGTLFSIIFLDLDELKTVNSKHGHLIGSRTLQEVAKRILSAVRGIDKVVRFGGDEFCIILPQTDEHQAVAVASRVRKAINGNAFRLEPNIEVIVTASFGIASFPTHAITKDNLIRQADAAMYQVKSTTKNAVGIANIADARLRL